MDIFRVFVDIFARGGWAIVGSIFLVSVVVWYIGLGRFFHLRTVARARKRFLGSLDGLLEGKRPAQPTGIEAYDVLAEQIIMKCTAPQSCASIKYVFREFLLNLVPQTEAGLSAMAAWTSIAPLLGLLGTVMGMIQTFKVITAFGVGNPSLTAEGISVALITTQAGLTVAFPAMLLHNHLAARKTALVSKMLKDGEEIVNRVDARLGKGTGPSSPSGEKAKRLTRPER